MLPFGAATLFFEAEIAFVYVLDLPELSYDIYNGYFGDPIEFDGENLHYMSVWGTVWAAGVPYVVATLPYVTKMDATSVY